MSNYTKATDFEAKDSLPSGDSAKVVKGTEIEAEFDAISTAIGTKADLASPTFTGTVVIPAPFTLGGTSVTSTAAELNVLDGITATVAELNILDGVTSTAAELNILDGVTSTAAELNVLDGVTAFIDDDSMATASATNIPSGESVKAYVDNSVTIAPHAYGKWSSSALQTGSSGITSIVRGSLGIYTVTLSSAVTSTARAAVFLSPGQISSGSGTWFLAYQWSTTTAITVQGSSAGFAGNTIAEDDVDEWNIIVYNL